MKSGLGVEHEIVIYTGHKIYSGSDIKKYYLQSQSPAAKKRERRNIQKTLNLIHDEYKYNTDIRFSSINFTLYIKAIHLYIIPKLLGKPITRPLDDKDITEQGFITLVKVGEQLEPIIKYYLDKDPEYTNILLNMKDGLDLDWNNLGRYSEFITQNPFDRTIGSVTKELINMEELFLKIVKKTGFPKAYYPTFGTSQFVEFTTNVANGQKTLLSGDYNGSYHINMTLPYPVDITYSDFAYRNFYAMLTLQWFEPLLLSIWGQPDAYAFGDDGIFVEGSYRMMVNSFSGVGTVKLELHQDMNSIVRYFDSITDRAPKPNQLKKIHK